ncbi:transient receptor potential cation channel subfamily M member 2-like isoform X1 [Cheilinus undulatus]|uniref:transient receptor potential cation channel subfamily M member 2-like isoform X1 n=1 Tax=Cheilinus undulatus TaxID=241271 RepID=UPI001BD29405|nr:transient receptor potential cation channel subfamily M member 2-like isoform X1 [Cheilinus undulatus]XP_041662820.1 transient receptor potential cation channel subfamily M member 2-like isoform X1 [Cheilinus undulatus]XP_041662821.1 transient receptor potential cation channel subfamily M member 2-like isoform X1 [Cheilinus undulatus]
MQQDRLQLNQGVSCFERRCSFTSWIRENVKKRECCLFQVSREDVCKCGYSKNEHVAEAIKPDDFSGESWDRHRHIQEVPTDAFGDISFGGLGQKTGKYARVSTDTSPEILYQLLTEQWKLSPPNLLISVTGGAKNFNLKARIKNMFHRGLIKVAQTTGAWIITGGTHTGVMKHVGQAVRDYALSGSIHSQIVAIGVATWGIIHNKDTLVHPEGCFPAHYPMDIKGQGRLSCLDNNHTHFLLVDDGTQGQYGVEIELRSRLEKCVSRKHLGNKESGVTIPVVCVVLDGGPGTLNTIYNAMLCGTPCVILEGSGRIADVIAQAAGLPLSRVTITHIHQLMKRFFGQEYEEFTDLKIIEWTKKIQDIIRIPHLLTVFRISEDNHGDVDVAILQALLKASRISESLGIESWKRQLELAIAWNRVDIAETEIFTEENQWKSSDLHWAMFSALVGNKPQFVSLLLENGVSLRDFLQKEETLSELYKQMPACFFLRKLAKRVDKARRSRRRAPDRGDRPLQGQGETISMTHVSEEVRHLLGSFTQPIYPPSSRMCHFKMIMEDTSASQHFFNFLQLSKSQAESESPHDEPQRDFGRDLFLWAVFQNNKELAEIAWEQCRDCMSAALAATKILKKMAEEGSDADEAEAMRELANHYEKQAIGVFTECNKNDEERAQKLLVRSSPYWGRTTCLRLALEADDKSFVAQSGVQALLTQIWCGELSVDNSVWRVLICMVFFPLIYTKFLVFRRDEVIQREHQKNEEIKTVENVTGGVLRVNTRRLDGPQRQKILDSWSKLFCLYSAPQVKFYWNIVSYFAFLFLFAVVLMIDFQVTPSPAELLLYIWLLSLVCEEVRQLFHDPDGFGFRKKARIYINDAWNILDVLSIILFIIGLAFRLTSPLFYAGKIVLCIDFVVFCLRLMAIFTINKTLGPKIIIVKRMMIDTFFFMLLLTIWVVAYGVAKQGILIDNDSRLDWIVRGAVYEPYLIIFGDFPTNIDNAAFDIDACTMNGSDPVKPKCPVLNEDQTPAFPEWLTIIMLCVYLLFANILLLNLLIAIFNFTFQQVQYNTDTIWKFQRYELIKEYHSRPAAPPPFIIFSHLYLFIRFLLLRLPPVGCKEFKNELRQVEEEELLSWEVLMKDRYLLSTQQEQSQSMERRILDTAQKVTNINERLEREEESSSAAMTTRLARLEEQVMQTAKALQWIMDSLKSQGFASKEPPSLTSAAADESPDFLRNISEKEDRFHMNARQLHYPNSKITRFPVPEEKVPWEVSFSSYMPTYYTSEGSEDQVDGSELEGLDNYRNPEGRTGVRGRGALSHLGPNLTVDLVLTRWRDNTRSVLEYLAVWDDHGSLVLPGGPVQSADQLPVALKRTVGKKLYEKISEKASEGTKVFEGYVDDVRNTDNAWVETTVLNIHLDNNTVVSSHGGLQWQEVSSKTMLASNQRDSLRQVAELHNTKF